VFLAQCQKLRMLALTPPLPAALVDHSPSALSSAMMLGAWDFTH